MSLTMTMRAGQLIMTMERILGRVVAGSGSTALLVAAIFAGGLLGHVAPSVGNSLDGWMDTTVLLLIGLSIFEISFANLRKSVRNVRFLTIAWVINFIVVPTIGFAIASLFLSGQPLFYAGLVIYFIAPCTDWFLGFTRLAEGDTGLGAVLLPINMITQLLLYPVYLHLFAGSAASIDVGTIIVILVEWIGMPFAIAVLLRQALYRLLPATAFHRLIRWTGILIPFVIALLIVEILAANVGVIVGHISVFGRMLIAIFTFFAVVFAVSELVSRAADLPYPQRALLTMTTAARNAPLMLAITAIALPNQPLTYAAIVIGMLVELPHLTALRHILLSTRPKMA